MSDTKTNDSLLRLEQIIGNKTIGVVGLMPQSKASYYQGIRTGIYPAPIKHGGRSFWRKSDIEKIIAGGSL